ncbi:PIG-L deacetylase family protein [Williamsia herbipolensis]|uniref:PIG-L deacetylase family protein n=1 Tax=Williamsia herbipolensis TaxID=1603258 RepID=UPI0005F7825F|nr:PIG-L family deacetylase [Williamsia herbipolensis]
MTAADVTSEDAEGFNAEGFNAEGFGAEGLATAEQWRDWLSTHRLPALELTEPTRMLVVSAHPDDEVLGAGGLIAERIAAGGGVTVLCLSDGAASHPGSPTVSPADLARIRRAELEASLAEVGVEHVRHVGLPDGELADHAAEMEEAVAEAMETFGGHDLVLAPWRGDRHPDHEAAGRAAVAAAQRTGSVFAEYPVWMWHWATPGDPAVPWERASAHPLSEGAHAAKMRAVAAFVSQITDLSPDPADRAVLPPRILDRLTGRTEVFFT